MEDLVGRAVAQRLARAVVQPVLDLAHLLRRDLAEIDALREVLANQAVDVLVPDTFPRMVRSREVESRVQPLGDLPVTGELLAVVRGQGVHPVTVRPQAPQQGLGHRRCGLAAQQLQDRVPGGPVHRGQQGTPVPRADDRVQLPVPDPALLLHHRRTLGNVHPPRNAMAFT